MVRLGTQLRNRIHAVAADHGYDRPASYWTGPGRGWLAELDLPVTSREIVTDCLAVIDALAVLVDPAGRRAAPARQGRPARRQGGHKDGRVAKPRVSSHLRHGPAPGPRSIT